MGREGMPVSRMNKTRCEAHEHEDGDNFGQHHHVVGLSRLTDPAHQEDCKQHHDNEGWPVEAEMPSRRVQHVAFQIG